MDTSPRARSRAIKITPAVTRGTSLPENAGAVLSTPPSPPPSELARGALLSRRTTSLEGLSGHLPSRHGPRTGLSIRSARKPDQQRTIEHHETALGQSPSLLPRRHLATKHLTPAFTQSRICLFALRPPEGSRHGVSTTKPAEADTPPRPSLPPSAINSRHGCRLPIAPSAREPRQQTTTTTTAATTSRRFSGVPRRWPSPPVSQPSLEISSHPQGPRLPLAVANQGRSRNRLGAIPPNGPREPRAPPPARRTQGQFPTLPRVDGTLTRPLFSNGKPPRVIIQDRPLRPGLGSLPRSARPTWRPPE